jgi:hypothetical protein
MTETVLVVKEMTLCDCCKKPKTYIQLVRVGDKSLCWKCYNAIGKWTTP